LSSHVVNKLKPFPGLAAVQVTIILGCAVTATVVAGYSVRRSGLNPMVFHVEFVTDKFVLGQICSVSYRISGQCVCYKLQIQENKGEKRFSFSAKELHP
jgi:hypothetical protein